MRNKRMQNQSIEIFNFYMRVFCVKWLIIVRKNCNLIKCFSVVLRICLSNPIHLIGSILQCAIFTPRFPQTDSHSFIPQFQR